MSRERQRASLPPDLAALHARFFMNAALFRDAALALLLWRPTTAQNAELVRLMDAMSVVIQTFDAAIGATDRVRAVAVIDQIEPICAGLEALTREMGATGRAGEN